MDGAHALVEGVFGLVCADDCPGGAVVDHLLVWFLWAWSGLGGGDPRQLDQNIYPQENKPGTEEEMNSNSMSSQAAWSLFQNATAIILSHL